MWATWKGWRGSLSDRSRGEKSKGCSVTTGRLWLRTACAAAGGRASLWDLVERVVRLGVQHGLAGGGLDPVEVQLVDPAPAEAADRQRHRLPVRRHRDPPHLLRPAIDLRRAV